MPTLPQTNKIHPKNTPTPKHNTRHSHNRQPHTHTTNNTKTNTKTKNTRKNRVKEAITMETEEHKIRTTYTPPLYTKIKWTLQRLLHLKPQATATLYVKTGKEDTIKLKIEQPCGKTQTNQYQGTNQWQKITTTIPAILPAKISIYPPYLTMRKGTYYLDQWILRNTRPL